MKAVIFSGIAVLALLLVGLGEAGEFRAGAHGNFINPKDPDFDEEFGYGGILKYKFTDTLGIEVGVDYFRWKLDELAQMPFGAAPGPVQYREVDRIYPIYGTVMIFAPIMEQDARAYLGIGGGYYETDADIDGNYNIPDPQGGDDYHMTISGKVEGQWSVHAAVGADFQLSNHIYLNVEARYIFVDLEREQTHTADRPVPQPDGSTKQSVSVEDEAEFDNWQVRVGLEYSF